MYFQPLVFLSCCLMNFSPQLKMLFEAEFSLLYFSTSQFSCSVVSDSLGPRGLKDARLPCPSPAPGACSNSCPSSQWSHLTISSSVTPFSSCLHSFPTLGSFRMSRLFKSYDQSVGASASASVLPVNIKGWFPLRLLSEIVFIVISTQVRRCAT